MDPVELPFKCFKCQGELIIDDPQTEGYDGELAPGLYSLSTFHHEESFYVCPKCRRYYMGCPNCSTEKVGTLSRAQSFPRTKSDFVTLCRFNGHPGINTEEECRYCRIISREIPDSFGRYFMPTGDDSCYKQKEGVNEELEANDELAEFIWNSDYPLYDVSDKDLLWFDNIDEWAPTGYNGGECHFWECLKCGQKYQITDK